MGTRDYISEDWITLHVPLSRFSYCASSTSQKWPCVYDCAVRSGPCSQCDSLLLQVLKHSSAARCAATPLTRYHMLVSNPGTDFLQVQLKSLSKGQSASSIFSDSVLRPHAIRPLRAQLHLA
eukprot:5872541-Amphidinium_carterae.1